MLPYLPLLYNISTNFNLHPVYVDGQPAQIKEYNINDKSFFQLRYIGAADSFRVDFVNDIIVINNSPLSISTLKPTLAPPSISLPESHLLIFSNLFCF